MITKFEISAGKKESVRFDINDPVMYEPTSERWLKFIFDDETEIRFYTKIGESIRKLELIETPILGFNTKHRNFDKIIEIKEFLLKKGWNPQFYFNDELLDNYAIVQLH